MTKQISPDREVMDQLVCAKYVFGRATDELFRSGPYSAGIAVNGFQDSLEIVLRAIARHEHCPVKPHNVFASLIDTIEKHTSKQFIHRSSLVKLNQARVNFKHLGMQPTMKDATLFRGDLESFFQFTVHQFFGIAYEKVSLVSLIGHCRTENHLNAAEEHYSSGKFKEAIGRSAIGFAVFQKFVERSGWQDRLEIRRDAELDQDLRRLLEGMIHKLSLHDQVINLVYQEIPLQDYYRFRSVAPDVLFTGDGRPHVNFGRPNSYTDESARFCIDFVIDSVLRLKKFSAPFEWYGRKAQREFSVIRKSAIIVWPKKDGNHEIIREASEGEELKGHFESRDQAGYVAIVQDDEVAYILASDIKEVLGSN